MSVEAARSGRLQADEPNVRLKPDAAIRDATIPAAFNRRVVIERIRPCIDGGRFAIKRTPGETVEVHADVFADGHEVLSVVLRDRPLKEFGVRDSGFESSRTPNPESQIPSDIASWRETEMSPVAPGLDEWTGRFAVDEIGWHEYQIVAWVDRFRSWRRDLNIKAAARQDVSIEILEGSLLVRDAAARAEQRRLRPARDAGAPNAAAALGWPAGGQRGEAAPPTLRQAQGRPEHRRGASASEREPSAKSAGGGAPAPEAMWGPASSDDLDTAADANWLLIRADTLSDATPAAERVEAALDEELATLMAVYADRSRATRSDTLRVWVDRERARFGAWYEMFPRSAGAECGRSGTFHDAAALLPRIADLGFDVVYLPPVHPIGSSFRKGPNNSSTPGAADPGSPWAIGADAGGHTAIEPGLGTLEDFADFRSEAERLGLEVALDLAWQCSPDHPWVRAHPEWFRHRPDGSIKYAENPPKKYRDIYPFDFECDDWPALWQALLDVAMFWVDRGVRTFRTDNPHTKTFRFWEWMIDEVHRRSPDVIFLSEAFTRPTLMRYLAKAGFTQSYTYFTWRNSKTELMEYFTELTATDPRDYLRPNLFANTPDILHAYLQHGGRPAFEARLLLAATLGASYGIYSGFELCEGRALAPGSEEYANSEKYEYRKWDWDRPGNINELVSTVNRIRHQHEALQFDGTLRFHATDNPAIIAYSKTAPDGSDFVLTIVNLDPHNMQHGFVDVPVDEDSYAARDLIDDTVYTWRRGPNYVRFDPAIRQGHILWLPKNRD